MTDYDSIYHRLFDHAGMVAQLLRGFVPPHLLADFDLDGITRENAKLHADSGPRRDGDTTWCIPRRGGGEAFLLLLLEFQSTIAPRMALRMLVYAGLLWQHLERENRLLPGGRLPPLLPVVLYRGETPWSAPSSLRALVGLAGDSPLWEWQPDLRYYIIDEGRLSEAELRQREGLVPLLFRLESASDSNQFIAASGALSAWFASHPAPVTLRLLFMELIKAVMAPLAPGMLLPDDFLESGAMLVDRVKKWRQDWIEEGKEIGKEIGEQRGEQRGQRNGEAALLLRLLERRFGAVPLWVTEKVGAAETGTLQEWALRLLDAESLEKVFF
jgi:hypothetical protein